MKPRLARYRSWLHALWLAPALGAALGFGTALLPSSTSWQLPSRALAGFFKAADVPSIELTREPFIRKVSAEGNLRAVKAAPLSPPRGTSGPLKIEWTVPDGSRVAKGDVVVRFAPTDFEKQLEDARADRDKATTRREKERTLVGSALRGRDRSDAIARLELAQTRAFQSKDPEIFSKNQLIEAAIDETLSAARSEHATAARHVESALSKNKLDLIGVESKKAGLLIERAEEGLRSLTILAPHDGIIVFETDFRGNVFQAGDVVWGGQTIANAPLLDEMEAEVLVQEQDAGGLEVGQLGAVSLDAHPGVRYEAKVKRIDTLAKQRVPDSPSQYFGVTLELSVTHPELMKPGARVHATVVLNQAPALAVPRQSVFERDGRSVVYRWQGARFDAVPVKLGAMSPGRVVIEGGLHEGDRIALHDPTARPGDELEQPRPGDAKVAP